MSDNSYSRFRHVNPHELKRVTKRAFAQYCSNNGWSFDRVGLHEARVNSNKLSEFERHTPSFIVDRDFDDPETDLIWVEVKACNASGQIRIPVSEWESHSQLDRMREVHYALLKPQTKNLGDLVDNLDYAIKTVALKDLRDKMTADENSYTFGYDDV
jgi:hypothetical protein